METLGLVLDLINKIAYFTALGVEVAMGRLQNGHLCVPIVEFPTYGVPKSSDRWKSNDPEVVFDPANKNVNLPTVLSQLLYNGVEIRRKADEATTHTVYNDIIGPADETDDF